MKSNEFSQGWHESQYVLKNNIVTNKMLFGHMHKTTEPPTQKEKLPQQQREYKDTCVATLEEQITMPHVGFSLKNKVKKVMMMSQNTKK